MKPWILITYAVFGTLCMPRSDAQTLEWGMGVGAPLINSNGVGWFDKDGDAWIDEDGDGIHDRFVFELGAFPLNFDPNEYDVGEWLTHWRVFDRLVIDPVFGLSTSSIYIPLDVTSESQYASDQNSFAGLPAYMWIRAGGDLPVPGSEWFLARAENWTFPLVGGDCCGIEFIEWSISDLTPASEQTSGDVPKWGLQNNVSGGEGVFSFTPNEGFDGIQTHTFIPEPSSSLLLMLGAAGLVLTRRRHLVAR